ncbi:MAG: hypothetical protein AAB389_02015 [Patescibacteria group bacterium]
MRNWVIFGVILGIAFGVWITNEALFSEEWITAICAIFVTAVIGGWFARVAYGITHEDTSKNQKKD